MKIFCQKCGNELKDGVVICPKCGFENKIFEGRKLKKIVLFSAITLILLSILTVGILYYFGKIQLPPFIKGKANNLSYDQYLLENPNKKCQFEITDVKKITLGGPGTDYEKAIKIFEEYKSVHNIYDSVNPQEGWILERTKWELENYRWFLYEGTIKNTSPYKQFLKQMQVDLYTSNGVLLQTGYSNGDLKIKSMGSPKGIWIDSNTSVPFKVGLKYENEDYIKGYIDAGDALKETIYPWFDTCSY